MKFIFLFFILLHNSLGFTQDACEPNFPELKDLVGIQKKKSWWAATDKQINNAPCSRKTPFTIPEIHSWLEKNQSNFRANRTIHGITFENESEENLKSFAALTTMLNMDGLPAPKEQPVYRSQCKKVLCAMKELFGTETAEQLLYMHRRYGLNGSHINLTVPEAAAWKKEELDIVLLAISDYPDGIFPIHDNKRLFHYVRSWDKGKTIANARISVFSGWDDLPNPLKRSALFHELAHSLGFTTEIDENPKWMKLSGWKKTTKVVDGKEESKSIASKPDSVISEYGLENEAEDLAESAVAYRYNPLELKKISPEKYNFIKETMFDNVEYTSASSCENAIRNSERIVTSHLKELSRWKPSTLDFKAMGNKCSNLAIEKIATEGFVDLSSSDIQYCYQNAVSEFFSKKILAQLENSPNKEFIGPLFRNKKYELPKEKALYFYQEIRKQHAKNLKEVISNGTDIMTCFKEDPEWYFLHYKEEKLEADSLLTKHHLNKIYEDICKLKKHFEWSAIKNKVR